MSSDAVTQDMAPAIEIKIWNTEMLNVVVLNHGMVTPKLSLRTTPSTLGRCQSEKRLTILADLL